jgi:hypothetical protein
MQSGAWWASAVGRAVAPEDIGLDGVETHLHREVKDAPPLPFVYTCVVHGTGEQKRGFAVDDGRAPVKRYVVMAGGREVDEGTRVEPSSSSGGGGRCQQPDKYHLPR